MYPLYLIDCWGILSPPYLSPELRGTWKKTSTAGLHLMRLLYRHSLYQWLWYENFWTRTSKQENRNDNADIIWWLFTVKNGHIHVSKITRDIRTDGPTFFRCASKKRKKLKGWLGSATRCQSIYDLMKASTPTNPLNNGYCSLHELTWMDKSIRKQNNGGVALYAVTGNKRWRKGKKKRYVYSSMAMESMTITYLSHKLFRVQRAKIKVRTINFRPKETKQIYLCRDNECRTHYKGM